MSKKKCTYYREDHIVMWTPGCATEDHAVDDADLDVEYGGIYCQYCGKVMEFKEGYEA